MSSEGYEGAVSSGYKAIDFVGAYADALKEEDEYSQVDDMLRAAAILTVKAEEMLDATLPEDK